MPGGLPRLPGAQGPSQRQSEPGWAYKAPVVTLSLNPGSPQPCARSNPSWAEVSVVVGAGRSGFSKAPKQSLPARATKWEFELREEQNLGGPACTATVPVSGVRKGVRGRATLQGMECRDHWFQGPEAPLGSREGRGVGGDPSLSSPFLLPTPRSWEAQATRLTLSSRPGVPRAALPSKGRDIKVAAAGSGCGRGGRALGRWLRWAPFHPLGGSRPPGRSLWTSASPCRPGEGGLGAAKQHRAV